MGIREVTHQIGEEAKQRAELLMNDADAEIKRIKQQTTKQLQEYRQQQKDHAESVIETARKKVMASAEFEGKRQILDRKKALISAAFEHARRELRELSEQDRKRLLLVLLARAQRELEVHAVQVRVGDEKLLSGVAVRAGHIDGGLVAENKHGTISVDYSFDTLLERIKQQHLRELSEVLFS